MTCLSHKYFCSFSLAATVRLVLLSLYFGSLVTLPIIYDMRSIGDALEILVIDIVVVYVDSLRVKK